jgi:hypothetical protein
MDGRTDDDLGSAHRSGGCYRCTKESVQEEMIWRKYMNQVTVGSFRVVVNGYGVIGIGLQMPLLVPLRVWTVQTREYPA